VESCARHTAHRVWISRPIPGLKVYALRERGAVWQNVFMVSKMQLNLLVEEKRAMSTEARLDGNAFSATTMLYNGYKASINGVLNSMI
jgi:hypothetical protein